VSLKLDTNTIQRIQQANDIVDVVSEHLRLDRKGREFVGLCPFHPDRRPSLNVSPGKQIFKCFACGAGGDVFKFLQLREGLTFVQAIQRLAERAGIKLQHTRTAQDTGEIEPGRLARVNAWAQEQFRRWFKDGQTGSAARSYVDRRGFSTEMGETWGLGFAPDRWDAVVEAARGAKVPDRLLEVAGLAVRRDDGSLYDRFRNRLMFPIRDATGRIIGFGGRTLGDDPAKYLNSPTTPLFDKSNSMYGLDQAHRHISSGGTAVVVEGYTDVMMSHQFGRRDVVGTLGTSFTEGHARILRRYAKRVILLFDSDTAGIEAANRALEVFLSHLMDIRLAFVPEGKDPCDFLLAAGKEALDGVLAGAVDVMEFIMRRLEQRFTSGDNLTDRRRVLEDFLRRVAMARTNQNRDPVADGLITARLAEVTKLRQQDVRRELARICAGLARNQPSVQTSHKVVEVDLGHGRFAGAQREILGILLSEPRLFADVRGELSPDRFDVPALRRIAEPLWEALGSGEAFTLASLLARIESQETASAVITLEQEQEQRGDPPTRLAGAIGVFREFRQDQERRLVQERIERGDEEALRQYHGLVGRPDPRRTGLVPEQL